MEKFFQKIKKIKHIEIYGAIIVIVIMIAVFMSSFNKGGVSSATSSANASINSGVATSEEIRMGHILSQIAGAGSVSVMRTDKGIVVVASGANDPLVKFNLLRAVQTLLNDNTIRIEILCSK